MPPIVGAVVEARIGRPDIPRPWLTGGPKIRTDVRTGAVSEYEYGGSQSEIFQYQINAFSHGATDIYVSALGTGDYRMEARYPWDQFGYPNGLGAPVPSIHELECNSVQRSLLESPIAQQRYPLSVMAAIQLDVQQYQQGTPPDHAPESTPTADPEQFWLDWVQQAITDTNADGGTLFKAIAGKNLVSFQDYEYVYRRTLTAATPTQVALAHTGEKQIWLASEIFAFEGLPLTGFFQLPSTDTLGNPTLWLKSFGCCTAVQNQKTQLTYFYTQMDKAACSSIVYQPYGSAGTSMSDRPGT